MFCKLTLQVSYVLQVLLHQFLAFFVTLTGKLAHKYKINEFRTRKIWNEEIGRNLRMCKTIRNLNF